MKATMEATPPENNLGREVAYVLDWIKKSDGYEKEIQNGIPKSDRRGGKRVRATGHQMGHLGSAQKGFERIASARERANARCTADNRTRLHAHERGLAAEAGKPRADNQSSAGVSHRPRLPVQSRRSPSATYCPVLACGSSHSPGSIESDQSGYRLFVAR